MKLGIFILIHLVNAFLIFLWLVFGLAAAGTASSHEARVFLYATGLGAGIPLMASTYCFARRRFSGAFVIALLPFPTVVGMLLLAGPVSPWLRWI